jgi:hypothetical protein
MQGMKGEYITDSRCWIIATHHPFNEEWWKEVRSHKQIYIVRNPIDSIMSTLNFLNMFSHSARPDFELSESTEWFDKAVRTVADM